MKRMIWALCLLLAPLAAFGQLNVEKKYFSMTYPAGWETNPFLPMGDTVSIVMDTVDGGVSWTHGITGVSDFTAAQYAALLTQVYTQSLVRTDSSNKVLGGKTFITTGWKDTTEEDSTSRIRIYIYQQGSFLLVSWVAYDIAEGTGSVADVESALATLVIKPAALHIRSLAWNRRVDGARPRIDILGRTWSPGGSGRIPSMPYFLRR